MLTIPASHVQVKIRIDETPLETVQVGDRETYDRPGNSPDIDSEYAISDRSGYLDLLADHHLEPGIHKVSYRVNGPQAGHIPICIRFPHRRKSV